MFIQTTFSNCALPDANGLVLIGQVLASVVVEALDGAGRGAEVVLCATGGCQVRVVA